MKTKFFKLSALAASVFVSCAVSANVNNPLYVQEMNEMAKKIDARLTELRELAKNPDYVVEKNGKRYLTINEVEYEVNDYGNTLIPLRHWSDDSAIRNLFTFFDQNWELSQYEGGATFVNTTYGNYDYGNGCLIEYFPKELDDSKILLEASTCHNGSDSAGSIVDEAQYINPGNFAMNASTTRFVAMDQAQDTLAVISSPKGGKAEIGITNIATGIGSKITGVNGTEYFELSDIRIHHNQIFVTADSNRVDVFDLATQAYQYSLKLENSYKLSGKMAITDKYIMVTGEGSILVYPNVQGAHGAETTVEPFATLLAPADTSKPHSLEVINNQLLAVSTKETVVYDLNTLQQGQKVAAANVRKNGFEAFDYNDGQIIARDQARIATYDAAQFVVNGFEYKEATKAVYLVDSYKVTSTDLIVKGDEFYSMTDRLVQRVFDGQSVEFEAKNSVATKQVTFAALPAGAVSELFPENMGDAVIHSRFANTSSLVSTRLIDSETVEIANFTEFDLSNLQLDIQAKGQYNFARLGALDFIPAYTKIQMPLSFFNENKTFNTTDGSGTYNYTKMLSKLRNYEFAGSLSTTTAFRSRFTTETSNPQLDKIKKITADWEVSFRNSTFMYAQEAAWTPETAKQWLKLMTNMAYVMSSEQFAERWLNFKHYYGYDMTHVPGVVGTFTQKTYEDFLESMQKSHFHLMRKNHGLQTQTGIRDEVGTMFGMSDEEFQRIVDGDLTTFAAYLGNQINRNFVLDCIPQPCDRTFDYFENQEKGFVPMFIEVVKAMEADGDLIH